MLGMVVQKRKLARMYERIGEQRLKLKEQRSIGRRRAMVEPN